MILLIVCVVLATINLTLMLPIGRRYFHPLFVPVMACFALWNVAPILSGWKAWRLSVDVLADVIAMAWLLFLLWRFKHYGKIDYGRVRNYYRGVLTGHDPSVEGAPGDSKDR